ERVIVADLEAEANAAYRAAYDRWGTHDYPEAFAALLGVAAAYPDTDAAPRAILAATRVFAEWARRDTLDLVADFPVALVPPVLYEGAVDGTLGGTTEGGTTEPAVEPRDEPLDEPMEELLVEPKEEFIDEAQEQPAEPERDGWNEAEPESSPFGETPPTDEAGEEALLPFAPPPADTTFADTTFADTTFADTTFADTTFADTRGVTPDSLAVPVMPDFGLLDLYTLIETDYPGT